MEPAQRAKQGGPRIEADFLHDFIDVTLTIAQQTRCNAGALALQILVRCHVVNLLEQAQEVVSRQKRSACHIAQHQGAREVGMDEIGRKRDSTQDLAASRRSTDRNLPTA